MDCRISNQQIRDYLAIVADKENVGRAAAGLLGDYDIPIGAASNCIGDVSVAKNDRCEWPGSSPVLDVGTSALCRIVRLMGEGWTGEGCGCALSDSAIPNMIRAVQSTILLNMVPSLNNGNLSYETMKARPPLALAFFASLDHLVGAGEHQRWHFESERPGGPEIHREVELSWMLDRKLARLGALEDAIDIRRATPE